MLYWQACRKLYSSDHFPQIINILTDHQQFRERYENWIIDKANWEGFKNLIDLKHILNLTDPDEINKEISNSILHSAKINIPRIKPQHRKKRVPWWNHECNTTIKNKNKLFSTYKRHPTNENLVKFKKARTTARRTINECKKKCWQDFISRINSKTAVTIVWNQIRKILNKKNDNTITGITDSDGKLQYESKDIAEVMAEHYYKISIIHKHLITHTTRSNADFDSQNNEEYNQDITQHELNNVIKEQKRSAAGPDYIHSEMLKNLTEENTRCILYMFNQIWKLHKIPKKWNEATIVPILKSDKDKYEANSYRPISLTCALCKLLEKIIARRMMWTIENKYLLDKHQSGFRKGRSTIDNILRLQQEILDGFTMRQYTVCVFFDIEKAFDHISKESIINTLYEMGFRGNLAKFVIAFLQNRKFKVRVGNALSTERNQISGVPQGSVLSPLLFILALSDLQHLIKYPVNYSIFADDLAIYIRGNNITEIEEKLQKIITELEKWGITKNIHFSTEKTCVINFTKKTPEREIKLKLNNTFIVNKNRTKFLGLIFDNKLSWKPHIENIKLRCTKALNLLKMLHGKSWGSDRSMLLRLYGTNVRSIMDYGSIAYVSASESTLRKLNVIQNNALRICSGAFCTSPVISLHAETNITSLTHR